MPTIGIIANPASGKDIRRLVSYATTIDNREKVNIVKRITLAAQSMGIDRILFMPDTFQIGRTVMSDLARDGLLEAELCVLDMPITASYEDTIRAAELMEAMGAGCASYSAATAPAAPAAQGAGRNPHPSCVHGNEQRLSHPDGRDGRRYGCRCGGHTGSLRKLPHTG